MSVDTTFLMQGLLTITLVILGWFFRRLIQQLDTLMQQFETLNKNLSRIDKELNGEIVVLNKDIANIFKVLESYPPVLDRLRIVESELEVIAQAGCIPCRTKHN